MWRLTLRWPLHGKCQFPKQGLSTDSGSPVGVDDLAESQLTAHLQVALMVYQFTRGTLAGIHFTVLIRLVQSFDELPCLKREGDSITMNSVLLNRIKGFRISVLNAEWEFLRPDMESTKDCYCFRTQGLLPPIYMFIFLILEVEKLQSLTSPSWYL